MEIITSDDILGKDVVDIDGEIIGVVQQLQIDKKKQRINGVVVDQGFMKADLYIPLSLVKNFGVDSIFLKESPKTKIKGLDVFDCKGKKIGYVSEIEEEKGKLKAIIIKRRVVGKTHRIEDKEIKRIGFNIILKEEEKKIIRH